MKLATFTANFKKAKGQDSARPSFQVSYQALESDDIATLDQEILAKVLNSNLESFGKQLIAEHSDNWDFQPDENQVNWDSYVADFLAPSQRGQRILSKANLDLLAPHYRNYLVMELKKSPQSADLNCQLMKDKFSKVSADMASLTVIANNLADFTPPQELSHVYDALLTLLAELMQPATKITAEAL